MKRVFISYRRSDSQACCDLLFRVLCEKLGADRVFRDIDDIKIGSDVGTSISHGLTGSEGILVVIGPKWVDVRDSRGSRRLDNPQDYLRREIEFAFAEGMKVLPVLVDGANRPSAESLPESLRPLLKINAAELRTGRDLNHDVDGIISAIGISKSRMRSSPWEVSRWMFTTSVVLILICGSVFLNDYVRPVVKMHEVSAGIFENDTSDRKRAHEVLNDRMALKDDISFENRAISDVIVYLQKQFIPIRLDTDAFEANGASLKTIVVNANFVRGTNFRERLQQLIAGVSAIDLHLGIDDSGLVITTAKAVNRYLDERVYDLSDLIATGETQQSIARTIVLRSSSLWMFVDGTGGKIAAPSYDRLSIQQTLVGHDEIERILQDMRVSRRGLRRVVFNNAKESLDISRLIPI